ncbi:hypothetical protein LIER_34972 [Lithospermum erythrorhizon]|uniref:Uncharacterized protein n=1 Tax=Lithospermum erythrorhizon TaxID=34254 RepID=A0AAV3NHC5_LITER
MTEIPHFMCRNSLVQGTMSCCKYRPQMMTLWVNGGNYKDIGSNSYMEDFGPMSVTNTKNEFSIQFS